MDARQQVLRRAVTGFGPLTVDDLAWWLPAPKREVKAFPATAEGLASVVVAGQTYWFDASLDDDEWQREALGASLWPYEDSLIKGYRDRDWLLAPGLREVLFPFSLSHFHPPDGVAPGPGPHKGVNLTGEARPSIGWQGRLVGRWEERDGGVVWQLHADIGSEGRRAVELEVDRLVDYLTRPLLEPRSTRLGQA